MKTLRNLAMAAAFVGLTAAPAKADFGPQEYCGGSNFETCASIALVFNGTNEVTITVTNNGPGVYTNVGLIGLPAGRTVAATGGSGGNGGNWASWSGPPPADLVGDGLPEETYGMSAPSAGGIYANGLLIGQTISFTFSIGGAALTTEQMAALGVGIRAQAGPNGCSTKLGVVDGQVIDNVNEENYAECGTTVPEPASMFLFGAGVVGILATRRRRNALEG